MIQQLLSLLNSQWTTPALVVAAFFLLSTSEPVKLPKLGLLDKVKSLFSKVNVPSIGGSDADYFRTALTALREKASHKNSFPDCKTRMEAFDILDLTDELVDKLFPVEAK